MAKPIASSKSTQICYDLQGLFLTRRNLALARRSVDKMERIYICGIVEDHNVTAFAIRSIIFRPRLRHCFGPPNWGAALDSSLSEISLTQISIEAPP